MIKLPVDINLKCKDWPVHFLANSPRHVTRKEKRIFCHRLFWDIQADFNNNKTLWLISVTVGHHPCKSCVRQLILKEFLCHFRLLKDLDGSLLKMTVTMKRRVFHLEVFSSKNFKRKHLCHPCLWLLKWEQHQQLQLVPLMIKELATPAVLKQLKTDSQYPQIGNQWPWTGTQKLKIKKRKAGQRLQNLSRKVPREE